MTAGAKARRRRESVTGLAMVAPAVLLFVVFGVYTLGYAGVLSFYRWNGISPDWTWVGLGNFRTLFFDDPILAPVVRGAVKNTLIVAVALPVLTIAISLPLAVMLNSITRFRALLRTVYFLPYVTSGIAVFYAWRFLFEPDGGINRILRATGMGSLSQPEGFLGNPNTALPALIAVLVWSNVPLGVLIYLTGLQTLDESVIEASRIDGAGPLRRLTAITWPLLRPVTALLVILQIREAFQGFQIFLLMTDGGPLNSTNTMALQTYRLAFGLGGSPDLGYASTIGWTLCIIAALLAAITFRSLRSRV